MKNSIYWEKRVANKTWEVFNGIEKRNKALIELYQEASDDIQNEIFKLAKKMETDTLSYSEMHKYNRLNKLDGNMNKAINELSKKIEKNTKVEIKEGFIANYDNTMKGLGKLEYSLPNKRLIEQLLDYPWSGQNFSGRLWENTRVLERNLNEIMVRGLVQGQTIVEMATELNNRMMKGYKEAHRLVRTETMHYLNESSMQAYKDAGIGEVQFWAAIDERTCPECGKEHGKIYKIGDEPILPLHPNCRCTYIPVVDIDKPTKVSGALTSENDPDFTKRNRHAKQYYESVRKRNKKHEVSAISNNTGLNPKTIEKAYSHIFINKYDLEEGYDNFYPDYDMAQSWQRLREGKSIQEHDLIMLKHERLEYELMNRYNKKYEEAHKLAESRYNYTKALFEYLKKNNLE